MRLRFVTIVLVLIALTGLMPIQSAEAQSPRTTHNRHYTSYHHRRRNVSATMHRTGHHIRSGARRAGRSIKRAFTGHN